MTDVVQALRQGSLTKDDYRWEAADEIERLRAENEKVFMVLGDLLTEAEDVFDCMSDAVGIPRRPLPKSFIKAAVLLMHMENRKWKT